MSNLRNTGKRLARDSKRAEAYCEEIWKQVRAGPVKKLGPDILSNGKSWFITHYLVTHNGKNCIVFNCSYQFCGLNLNDVLLPGPTLGASLLGVLMCFRQHIVAISSDIQNMFHQVRLLPEDPPGVYGLQVLPFCTVCFPCCVTFAL